MKTTATVMQVSRSLLILTPAEYDKPEATIQISAKKNSVPIPTIFGAPQIFELKDSLKGSSDAKGGRACTIRKEVCREYRS